MRNPFRKQKPNVNANDVKRIILFSGATGSGKTTFLKNPYKFLRKECFPKCLSDFGKLAKKPIDAFELFRDGKLYKDEFVLHLSIQRPIVLHGRKNFSLGDLPELITPTLYSEWDEPCGPQQILNAVKRLDVVIFYVRRENNFARWIDRQLRLAVNGVVNTRVAAVLGDSSNHDALHRKLYRSWLDHVEGLYPDSISVIDATNEKSYAFMSIGEFRQILE